MKLKKWAISSSIVFVMGLLSSCSGISAVNKSNQDMVASEALNPITINMFTGSPEYSDAYNAYIEEYKKVKPNVTINLEIMQTDYRETLLSRISTGSMPDVFQTTAGGEINAFAKYSADLTDEPLAAAMTDAVRLNMTSSDGRVLGVPLKGNLFTLIYNKKLLEEAGINSPPRTMADMRVAVSQLEKQGITPFANAYKEWWVWKHIFQHYVNAAALESQDTPKELIRKFQMGEAHFSEYPALYDRFFEFVDMTVDYDGIDDALKMGSSDQVKAFAAGKVAFMTGKGAWEEEAIKRLSPDFEMGIIGYPVSNVPGHSRIITGADQALRINKDSKVADEAVEFFNWLYTSDYGKAWFSDVAKVIPPIQDAPLPDLDMPKQMKAILQTELSGDLSVNHSTDTFHRRFGEIMQSYVNQKVTKYYAIKEIEEAWLQYSIGP